LAAYDQRLITSMRRLCEALVIATLLSACSDSADGNEGGTLITVTTTAPTSSLVPGGRTTATWAGFRSADGSWVKLDQAPGGEVGKYTFNAKGDRWAIAFACSDGDMALVAVHEDLTSTTTNYEVELDRWCAPELKDGFTVSGTLSHLPGEVGWLDFGYELEARGAVLPNNGTTADYEQVNVAPGTWDFALGVRSDSTTVLSKIAILRRQVVTADARLDVDLGAALTPGSKALVVRGLGPMNAETLSVPVHYTTKADGNGKKGLDVGPPTFEQTGPEVTTAYSTIPPEAQLPTDRYRLDIVAHGDVGDSGEVTQRGAVATLHDAIDVEVTLSQALGAPSIMPIAQGSFARVSAKTPARPMVATYELSALAKITNRQMRVWRITMNAALVKEPEASLVLPDLFPVTGFDPSWGLPSDMRREVTVKATEKPVPLGDGTITHYVSHTTIVRPHE
jgi:hypothetical protein